MSDNMTEREKPRILETFKFKLPPIKGFPELRWAGKRPFRSTHYYPAQLKENHGDATGDWINQIYWGDNLQVMSHLLKEYRGKIKLIYIDPPFDSKADYKKKIQLKGKSITNDQNSFEEKQYTDIWTNDEYLQFMYERLILMRELLADDGSIYVHCDWHKSHVLRCILDEVFSNVNFRNEVTWKRRGGSANPSKQFDSVTDTILWYAKTDKTSFISQYSKQSDSTKQYIEERFNNIDENGRRYMKSPIVSPNFRENLVYEYKGFKSPPNGWSISIDIMKKWDNENKLYFPANGERIYRKIYLDEYPGQPVNNLWNDIFVINPMAKERLDYPTQKPEKLIERIIKASSNPGDLVFDCFMGSGTTQAVAMKLGRRFIGADINLGAIQITTKRLLQVSKELSGETISDEELIKVQTLADSARIPGAGEPSQHYIGFSVFNVNNYDIFRNPIQARELLSEALELQSLPGNILFDGEKDGRMVKILPVNRIATRADLNELISNLDYKAYEKRQKEHPRKPVEQITLVCMGHEPDLAAVMQEQVQYKLDIRVVDILRDRKDIQFKRDSEARIKRTKKQLEIKEFYPMDLLQKFSFKKENVIDWKEMVESVMIDFYYDGVVFEPQMVDVPKKNELVQGKYPVPDDASTIRVKITDLLSESLEMDVK